MHKSEQAHGAQWSPQFEQERQWLYLAQTDPNAFAPLYDRYFPRVYAYCAHRVDSPQEAEDLCSQVFLNILKGIHTYQGGRVGAWIFRIAHHVVANHYRKRKPILSIDDLEFPVHDSHDEAEEARLLAQLIATLPNDKRDLLHLMLDSGLTSAEIGDMLGKSAGAVRVEFHRIVQHIKQRYLRSIGEA